MLVNTTSLLKIQFPPPTYGQVVLLYHSPTCVPMQSGIGITKYAFTKLCSPCQNVFSDLGFPYSKQMVVLVIEDNVICCACCLYSLGKNFFSGFTLV